MKRKFTANGNFIPQDAMGNDMCILFMKYGRCRYKTKCKKSHWVPPLPSERHPDDLKPPLPTDNKISKQFQNTSNTIVRTINEEEFPETASSNDYTTIMSTFSSGGDSNSIDVNSTSVSLISQHNKSKLMRPRRFKHVFFDDFMMPERFGLSKLFEDAGAYYDNITQKVQISRAPTNKIEKRHLKMLRRIHWRLTQNLKEKLWITPPSFKLTFDKRKINFAKCRPYICDLIHECMCVEGDKIKLTPSSFESLIVETLLAYLEHTSITPHKVEEKLRNWGARSVRARQCVEHLWHFLAISAKCPFGHASLRREDDVTQSENQDEKQPKDDNLTNHSVEELLSPQLSGKRRKRSRQFKKLSLSERQKFTARLKKLLSTLS